MKILGLDPGFGITGWGFVSFRGSSLNQPTLHSYGALTTPTGQPLSLRLAHLQNQFVELLDRLNPDRVAMERLFFGRNITTAEGVYQARGVLLAAMGQKSIVPIELTPNQIKQSITGSGKARKPEMMRMVQMLLNIDEPIRPDDAADALGCAIAASAISNLEYQQLQHPPQEVPLTGAELAKESMTDPVAWPGPSIPIEDSARLRRRTSSMENLISDSDQFAAMLQAGSEIRFATSEKKGNKKGSTSASKKKQAIKSNLSARSKKGHGKGRS